MLTAGALPFKYTSDCVLSQRFGVDEDPAATLF